MTDEIIRGKRKDNGCNECIIIGYKTMSTEDLFKECFNHVLRVIENYRSIPDTTIFSDFKEYVGLFYPK